jgi:predicted nucleic acid-binding protein
MRIVADTSTLVSGFDWGGPPGQVVDTVLSGQVTLVRSPALLGELARVLAGEPDNRVLEAAAAGRADLIVTGDKAMQELGSFQGIPIVSAAQFVAQLQQQGDTRPPGPGGQTS